MSKDKAKASTFNVAAFDTVTPQNTAQKLELVHPFTGEPLMSDGRPMTITLLGAKSKEFRAAINNAARVEAARRVKPIPSIEAEEARSSKLLAAATVGWDNILWGEPGEEPTPLPFSTANAEKLYRERSWIREQVDAFVADEKNFCGELGKN